MARFQKWIGFIVISAATATYFLSGCTRDISVTPTIPVHSENPTNTPTIAATFTSTLTPTNTGGATSTPTGTPTNSPTSTASLTPTNTVLGASTSTPTNTPTLTYSPTVTSSPTSTIPGANTSTATGTPTNTATIVFTATPTATACSPTYQANYTFASGTQCWTAWGSVTASISQSTSTFDSSVGSTASLQVILPFTSTTQQEQIGIQFLSPGVTILAGSTISFYVMASNNGNAMQIFDQSGPGAGDWDGGDWTNATTGYTAGTWFQMSYVVAPGAPTSVIQFGLQVPSGTGAGQSNGLPVTIWIDDVSITPPASTPTYTSTLTATTTYSPTITPSPTPTIPGANTSTATSSPTVTSSPTLTATATATTASGGCTVLYNACDTLLDNGVLVTTAANDANPAISTLHVTQGTGSVNVDVTTYTGFNKFLILNSVDQPNWAAVTEVLVDVYLDSALVTGTSYCQLTLQADSTVQGVYGTGISPGSTNLTGGVEQTVSIPVSFGAGTITPTSPLSKLYFILNSGGSTANVGNIYIDNIRLVSSACPPTPIYSWNFDDDTNDGWAIGGWFNGGAGETLSNVAPGYPGTGYALNDYVPFSAGGQQEALNYNLPGVDLTGRTLQADLWMDAAINNGYPGGYLFVQSGAYVIEQSAWNNLSPNAWTRITFTPTWSGTGEVSTDVVQVGAIYNTGGSGAPGNIKLDNFIIY
jgi:hypothetical protein